MSNRFVARKGLVALQDSEITGSLNITQNIVAGGTIQASFAEGTSTAISGAFDNVSSSLAQRVTPLETSVSSLNSASSSYLLNTSDTLVGDLTVTGTITAQEFHTEFVSASIIYQSGSTQFGNSSDDTHTFTGTGSFDRVGIGTTTPSTELTVVGNIKAGYESATGLILGLTPSSVGIPNNNVNAFILWGDYATFGGNNGDLIYIPRTSTYGEHRFYTGNGGLASEKMRITSSGNLGLGITPSSWGGSSKALQIGARMSLYNDGFNNALFGNNTYFNGSDNFYINTAAAARFYIENTGKFIWNQAASGTAGDPISFTQAMTLNASGNLSIGNTDDTYKLDVSGEGRFKVSTDRNLALKYDTNISISAQNDGGNPENLRVYADTFRIYTSTSVGGLTERFTIASTGASVFTSHVSIVNGAIEFGGAGSAPSTDPAIYRISGLNDLAFSINSTPHMTIKSGGNVGIGTTSPATTLHVLGSGEGIYVGRIAGAVSYGGHIRMQKARGSVASPAIVANGDTLGTLTFEPHNGTGYTEQVGIRAIVNGAVSAGSIPTDLFFAAGSSGVTADNEKMRLTSAGFLGIGTTLPGWKLHVEGTTGTSIQDPLLALKVTSSTHTSGILFINSGNTASYNDLGGIYGRIESGNAKGYLGFYTRNSDGDNSGVGERMRITSAGYVYLGDGWNATNHRVNLKVSQGNVIFVVSGYNTVENDSAIFYASNNYNINGAATTLAITTNSSTGRSINAGGTINASGSDYAEYITKAVEDIIAKGDIVGINNQAKLTNIFADAISFAVKSTDPSYVGGDAWFNSEKRPQKTEDQTQEEFDEIMQDFESRLEIERAKVDRIAFSGQVPCNVYNAQVGDYIIPVETEDGKIAGQPVSNPTFEQYTKAVGKVWKIMDDGRAWISVKIG